MSDFGIQGEVVLDSSKAETSIDRLGNAAGKMAIDMQQAGTNAGKAVDKIGDIAASNVDKFTRSESAVVASIKRLALEAAKAQPVMDKLGNIEFNIAAKGLDASKFRPMLDVVQQVSKEAQAAATAINSAAIPALNKMGVSAGQTNAALRQLPAQFTDIVTSLQAGQSPLTVFLQQGGQIKDSFGGAGNALKAMGGYVLSLISPLTVAAAAVGALGFAMYSLNGKEAGLLSLSAQLKGTGRESVAAAGDIKALVKELNLLPGVSKASATAIITEFAKVSGVGAELFRGLGSSVADFAAATGTDLPTAAKKLAEAFADPAKGAKALEESLGTLTAAQLLTIEKMAAMGDKSGAQVALMEALKKATKGLADEAMTPLGKATDNLSNAWDTMTTTMGKSDTLRAANDILAAMINTVATLTVKLSQMKPPDWLVDKFKGGLNGALYDALTGAGTPPPGRREMSGKVGQLDEYGNVTFPSTTAPVAPGNPGTDGRVKEALELTSAYKSQAGAMAQLKEVANLAKGALKELQDQNKGNSIEAQTLRDRIAGVNEKLAEMAKKGQGAANAEQNAYQSLMASIKEKIKAKQEEINFSGRLNESDKLRIQLDAQLETGAKKLTAAHKADALAQIQKLASLEKIIDATKRAVTAYQEQVAIQEELNAAYVSESKAREAGRQAVQDYATGVGETSKALELELSLMGKSDIERKTAIEQYKITLDLKKRIAAVNANQGFDQPQRDEEIGKLNAAAVQDKANAANKVMLEDWQKTVDKYDDIFRNGFADMVNNGKEGWDAFTKSLATTFKTTVADAIYKEFIKPIVVNVVGSFLGIGGGGGGLGGAAGGSSSGLGTLLTIGQQAYNAYNGTGIAGAAVTGVQNLLGIGAGAAQAGNAAVIASSYGGGPAAIAAAQNASIAAGGSATGGAGLGAAGAGGIAAIIMLGVINALGGMRTETMIGSGLAGTLGGANPLTPWQEWREGGTLFDGPSFATHNPLEELRQRKAELQRLRDSGQGESNYAVGIQAVVTDLEKTTKGLAEQTEVFTREIGKGYKAYRTNVMDMADSLGLAGDSVKDFAYTLGAQDLNFQGLNPEQIQAKIAETFGKAGVDMAQQLLGTWKEVTDTVVNTYVTEQMTQASDGAFVTDTTVTKRMEYQASIYAKTGETAIQTLTRLSTSFNTLNEAADALGFGIQQGSLALADFADDFIEAFGGLERFTASTGAFLQNYYTDGERREYLIRSGVRQAEKLGIQGLTEDNLRNGSREQLRDFVNTAASNPELYADALDLANYLSPIFGAFEEQAPVVQEVANVVDELTQSYQNAVKSLTGDRDSLAVEVLRAQGNEAGAKALERTQYLAQFAGLDEARRKEIETLYDGNVATRAYIQGIKDAAQAQLDALAKLRSDSLALIDTASGKTDAALAAYERAADKERERLQGTIDAVKAVFQAAEDGAKSFFGEVEAVAKFQGVEGRDFISQALASAQAGGALPDGKELSDAIAAVGKDFSATQFTSQAEADFQRLVVANELKGLQDISDDQLTEAERQLEALNDQVEFARDQVNALRGIDTKLKDLPKAIADLILAYNTEAQTRANVGAKAIIGTGDAIYNKELGTGKTSSGAFFDASDMAEVARDVIAANGAAGKGSVLDALEGKGYTMPQYNEIFGLPPGTLEAEAKALGRPIFHNGTTYVPETGFALLQQGEAVIPAAYNPWANGGGGNNNAEVVAELRAARGELLEMRKQLDTLNYQAKRSADANNGQPEAPGLVSIV